MALFVLGGAGYAALAFADGEIQKRSYPSSFGGQWQNKGYELIEELKLIENARRIGEDMLLPEDFGTSIFEGCEQLRRGRRISFRTVIDLAKFVTV